ncbi:MAG: phosphoribosylformylglycinamidine cyclo-ligase [Armatimonadota bacterium]|nr:phosphoribosylformylglycinamidine cyclo-ligase [Armatimonadota bacterium]
MNAQGLTYRDAGVDQEKKEALLRKLGERIRTTFTPDVLGNVGLFGGLYALGPGASDPVLVSSVDGVGTKTKVARETGRFEVIGRDVVAHCANDVAVHGARPLFFLDYVAMGCLEPGVLEALLEGMVQECKKTGLALVGGETAEMPGIYLPGELDVVGCVVGMVPRARLMDGSAITPGDLLIGLASSGLHTNGYSLARHVLAKAGISLDAWPVGLDAPLGEILMRPHRNYALTILQVVQEEEVHGIAHITGGGLPGNLVRILPPGCHAVIRRGSWLVPPIFSFLQEVGSISEEEMFRTFNMGIGLVLVVPPHAVEKVMRLLHQRGEQAFPIGEVRPGQRGVEIR